MKSKFAKPEIKFESDESSKEEDEEKEEK